MQPTSTGALRPSSTQSPAAIDHLTTDSSVLSTYIRSWIGMTTIVDALDPLDAPPRITEPGLSRVFSRPSVKVA